MVESWSRRAANEAISTWNGAARAVLDRDPFSGRINDALTWESPFGNASSGYGTDSIRDLSFNKINSAYSGFGALPTSVGYLNYGKSATGTWSGWQWRMPELFPWDKGNTSDQLFTGINSWLKEKNPWLYDPLAGSVPGMENVVGVIGSPADPKWANVNRWDGLIAQAVQQVEDETGVKVDPNRVKAHIYIESGGNPNAVQVNVGGNAYGLMQLTANARTASEIDWSNMDSPAYQIYAGVRELAKLYQMYGGQYGWQGVSLAYFTGDPQGYTRADTVNGTTGNQYISTLNGLLAELQRSLDPSQPGQLSRGETVDIGAIWAHAPNVEESQGFGQTSFAKAYPSTNGGIGDGVYWSYEGGHSGRDYAMPVGTKLYTPVAGTVVIADGTFYSDYSHGAAPQTGQLRIRLDNGDYLILGHMSKIDVQVGQRVGPGQYVGLSGDGRQPGYEAQGGPHIHLEYRRYDPANANPENPEHTIIVDPLFALMGIAAGPGQPGFRQTMTAKTYHDVVKMAAFGQLQQGAPIPYTGAIGVPDRNTLLYTSLRSAMGIPLPASQFGGLPGAPAGTSIPGFTADFGPLTSPGGEWATLDSLNPAIAKASGELGVPANLIKSMLAREGSFGRDRHTTWLENRGTYVYAFNGVTQAAAQSRGINWNRMLADIDYAVWAMAKVLHDIYYYDLNGRGTWDDAAAYYFAGGNYKNMSWSDELGNTVWSYLYHPTGGVITRAEWLGSPRQ